MSMGWSDDMVELKCSQCHVAVIVEKAFWCTCSKYGYGGHEELMWCSQDCMDTGHPDYYDLDKDAEDSQELS